MLFNSLQFLFFFTIVTCLYFLLRHNQRWKLLLFASCFFYMVFKPVYILILFLAIVVDYVAGIFIEKTEGSRRKLYLILSLITNIGILAIFKYYNFFNDNMDGLFGLFGRENPIPYLDIILPIGLSFHTFQAMSYTIEVYYRRQKAEHHFGIYALYVMYYPQLVAGPIERPQNLLPQYHTEHFFDWERTKSGLMMMSWGFFKKVVIADRLALFVDYSYNDIGASNGLSLLISTVFFAFQIYCDFSGYSEIAIGASKIMGIKLMDNFDRPYQAKTISEFWRRWHISLSTWFRDYLYIPLGGNRVNEFRRYFNLFFVFMVSGFWHGANWTFVVWGSLHGIYLVAAQLKNKLLGKDIKAEIESNNIFVKAFNILFIFILADFAWIFFRANNVTEAFQVISGIAGTTLNDAILSPYNLTETIFCMVMIGVLYVKEYFLPVIETRCNAQFWAIFLTLGLLSYLLGVFNSNQFIYFQF